MTTKEAIEVLKDMKIETSLPKAAVTQRKRNAAIDVAIEALNNHLADPGKKVSSSCGQENDPVSRKAAIDAIEDYLDEYSGLDEEGYHGEKWCAMAEAKMVIENLPPAQPKILACGEGELNVPDTNVGDMISRQTVLRCLIDISYNQCKTQGEADVIDTAKTMVSVMPSAQPERRCVNCGRTVNNGGWYEDGRTRCPIEEHYALPKDGYCHLWEKRNVTDDDYPERREE